MCRECKGVLSVGGTRLAPTEAERRPAAPCWGSLKQLDYQQEAALMSCIPLGVNRIEIQRGLTTSSTAIFVPFTTQELFQEGEALYYGLNALSNNMIMVDRKRLKNPNGLILGTPGSGKSFSAKREITNCLSVLISRSLVSS